MFDTLQAIFWSCAYILMNYYTYSNFKLKKVAMPLNSAMLNFAWEMNALILFKGLWAHIVWTLLDVFIIIYNVYTLSKLKKILYVGMMLFVFMFLWKIFRIPDGMLISCFLIDLYMAISFIIKKDRILDKGRIAIATFKLLGDLAAGIYYSTRFLLIFIIAITVLIINIKYLIFCIKNKNKEAAYAP